MEHDLETYPLNSQLEGRTLLVLGAGVYQIPAITTARAMGLKVIAVDGNPDAPGLLLANDSRKVDIRDFDRCLKVAEEFGVDGIISICTEAAVETVAALGETLGLPAISREAASYATDKYLMRERFSSAGIDGPAFRQACTLEEAQKAAEDIGYPLVLKPVDNAGSRGVLKVDGTSALIPAFEQALGQSRKKRVIVEEYMEGTEATIESLTFMGVTEILAISDKVHVPFPECVAISLTYPPYFEDHVQDKIKTLVKDAIGALKIDQGPTHTEVMVTSQGVKIVELGARGGGYQIFSDIVPRVSGVDIVRESINIAMGIQPQLKEKHQHAAVLRFFNPQMYGSLRSISGVKQATALDGIIEVVLDVKPGSPIGPIARDGDRPGYLISYAETRKQAVNLADEAEGRVRFEIEPISAA